jgi:hypothetical protein
MSREELIKRLEAGETGREIDAAAYAILFGAEVRDQAYMEYHDLHAKKVNLKTQLWKDGRYIAGSAPPYSFSLDAAVALVERVRPGAKWRVGHVPGDLDNLLAMVIRLDINKMFQAKAPTPAAALLAALLKSTEPHQ